MEGITLVAIALAAICIAVMAVSYVRERGTRRPRTRFVRGVEVLVAVNGTENRFIVNRRALRLEPQRLCSLLEQDMGLTPENARWATGEIQRIRAGGSATPGKSTKARQENASTGIVSAGRPQRGFQYRRILAPAAADEGRRAGVGHMTSSGDRFLVTLSSDLRHAIRVQVEDREPHDEAIAVVNIEHDGGWHRYIVPLISLRDGSDEGVKSGTIMLPTATPTVYVDYNVSGEDAARLGGYSEEEITSSVRLSVGKAEDRWRVMATEVAGHDAAPRVDARVRSTIRRALREMDGTS